MYLRKWTVFVICILFGVSLYAEEGMWQLNQIKDLELEKMGFQISAEEIYSADNLSVSNAIVWLGGCSASFVSSDGLVLTNHHCAYGALQRNSAKDGFDYITHGFLAKTKEEELPAIGQDAYVLQKMTDITDKINKTVKGINDISEKEKLIQRTITEMEIAEENGREDLHCYIAVMFNGKQYIKYLFKKYQDVRIVFAPPEAIGSYGGDIDNWMWPRHTGDFTYLRVYQAPDGSGAKYSPDNVPVKPEKFLKISDGDLNPGDMTFIMGFPGRTMRYRTSYSVEWNLNKHYLESIDKYQTILNLIKELSENSEEARLKLANLDAGLNNAMKNYQGNVDGMKKSGFVENKKKFEADLTKFINKKRKLRKKYGTVLNEIEELYSQLEQKKQKDDALKNFGGYVNSVLYSLGADAYEVARERAKPEDQRRPEFSENQVKKDLARLEYAYLRFYEPYDKIMMTWALNEATALPDGQRISELDQMLISNEGNEAWVDHAFEKTGLRDLEYVKGLYEKTAEEIEALDDPLIQLAVKLYDVKNAAYEASQVWNAEIKELRRNYIDALYEWKGSGLYPDANSTIRFTYGPVNSYLDYKPFTQLEGVVKKNTGEVPFNNPEKLTELSNNREYGRWADPDLNDVPACFLCECDITSGNSGSAVLNARGELIGLAFDGNYEAMTSDWLYDGDLQRTIAVDIRYVMFITEKFADADHLIKEMGL